MIRLTLGEFIKRKVAQVVCFADYLILVTETTDYHINMNNIVTATDDSVVVANNVNGVWYFKLV